MEKKANSNTCPQCQGPLAPDAPEGLCPACLLRLVDAPTDTGQSFGHTAAPPSEYWLREAFPELEIHELIGQGGMGAVFKARQRRMKRLVALKVLPENLAKNPEFAERFAREAQVLARLNHPTIVTLYEFGERNGIFYLLMEYVDGVNLRQAMAASRFSPQQALKVIPHLCDALEYAHEQGVLHRDIKPANILMDTNGTIKLADFGIAKLGGNDTPDTVLTQTGGSLGTPQYMAPEQIEKPSEVDHRADIYSLGVVLYEMLTGELPIGRFAPPSAKSDASPGLDSLVFKALEKEREARQQTAAEMRSAVQTVSSPKSSVSEASEPDSTHQSKTLSRFHFWLFGLVFTSLIALVGYDILMLMAAYFELMQNLSIFKDDRFFLRVAFEGASVFGCLHLVWSRRSGLVARFPLKHPSHDLSLYPLALAALLVAVIPLARDLALLIGIHSNSLWLPASGVALGLIANRVSIPRAQGIQDSPTAPNAGRTFLWLGLIFPLAFQALNLIDSPVTATTTTTKQTFNINVLGSLSLGWFSFFYYVGPTGLALLGRSRTWRTIAIVLACCSLTTAVFGIYGFFEFISQSIASSRPNFSFSASFWLRNLSSLAIPLAALSILLGPKTLAHFGLEYRRSEFIPRFRTSIILTPKMMLRAGLLLLGLGVISSGGIAYLFETGGKTIARNQVDSYKLEFLTGDIKQLQEQTEHLSKNLVSVLSISSDRLGNVQWDAEGQTIPGSRRSTEGLTPLPSSDTCHILLQLDESVADPISVDITLGKDRSLYPMVSPLTDRLRLLTFSAPQSMPHIKAQITVTPSKNSLLAQARTGRERQLSNIITFDWKAKQEEAQQVIEWMDRNPAWTFEMWGHSMIKSSSSHSTELSSDGNKMTAVFPDEIGPYSSFTLFARPRYQMTIDQIPLKPRGK